MHQLYSKYPWRRRSKRFSVRCGAGACHATEGDEHRWKCGYSFL